MPTFNNVIKRKKIIKALKKQKIPSYTIRWERIYTFCEKRYIRKYARLAGISHLTINKLARQEQVWLITLSKFIKYFNKPTLPWLWFKYVKQGELLKLSDVVIPLNLRAKKLILGIERISFYEI